MCFALYFAHEKIIIPDLSSPSLSQVVPYYIPMIMILILMLILILIIILLLLLIIIISIIIIIIVSSCKVLNTFMPLLSAYLLISTANGGKCQSSICALP